MVSVDHGLDPLLKRPFSVHRLSGKDFQILYRIVGKGTAILSERKEGDILDIVGPLGNGFPPPGARDRIILVAGGLGIAPIFALAERLKDKKPLLFYGARTKKELLCTDEFRSLGIDRVISTDDGSSGRKGFITDTLRKFLIQKQKAHYCLYACGPEPMLASLSALAGELNQRGYVALEQNMACGIGTCLGCVVHTKGGYKRICKEGPVFRIGEIVWEGQKK